MAEYVPRKGDFIALTFDPQSGHEQRGRRPALVVSNDLFNEHTGCASSAPSPVRTVASPSTSRFRPDQPVAGFVMVEQVKSVDFRARKAKYIGQAPRQVLEEVAVASRRAACTERQIARVPVRGR